MYYFFSLLCGMISSLMVTVNGKLTGAVGGYSATVIIHIAGLLLVLVLLAVRRERVRLFSHGLPWQKYLGGTIGVATVVTTNLAFGGVSVTAMVALTLFGQTLTSLAVDQFGLLGMQKRPFRVDRLWGLLFVALGIVCMLLPFSAARPVSVLLAMCGGITIVISRSINGELAARIGSMPTTLYNYITGLTTAVVAMLLLGRGEPVWMGAALPTNPLLYIGGCMGVATVTLQNVSVRRISAVYMTLLQFIGQVAMGIAVDALLAGGVTWQNLVGGICISCGMALNLLFEQRAAKKSSEK